MNKEIMKILKIMRVILYLDKIAQSAWWQKPAFFALVVKNGYAND